MGRFTGTQAQTVHQLFDLSGTTAIVAGYNTGLGQGMALALAAAGADIVGVNRSDTSATREGVEKRRGRIDPLPGLRMGEAPHQRQRDRAEVHGDEQHRCTACRC